MESIIFIEGRRDGYSVNQVIDQTITVEEFISILENFDPQSKVLLRNDRGYTYGVVNGESIEEGEPDFPSELY